jgi:ribosomal protein S18 acetylase RimI-like enzyme
LLIRRFLPDDAEAVIALWESCGLVRNWNDPHTDINRKLKHQPELFFVGEVKGQVIATAMFGYEGHRGWVNYLAVSTQHQRLGYAACLMRHGEDALTALGCPKLNLQIRNDNEEAIGFYKAMGYLEDQAVSFGKRLIKDQ